jgi:hypothetical protein
MLKRKHKYYYLHTLAGTLPGNGRQSYHKQDRRLEMKIGEN